MDSKWFTGILLLGVCPGVTNAYSTGVAGLVAATIVGFFLLVAIIVLIALAVLWNEWYRDRMAKRGYRKGPRRSWRLCEFLWPDQQSTYQPDDRPSSVRLYNMPRMGHIQRIDRIVEHVPASQVTTIDHKSPDAWTSHVKVIQPSTPYEEKTQTLDFLSEDEPVYETKALGGNTTHVVMGRTSASHRSTSDPTQAVYVTNDSTTHATTLTTSQRAQNVSTVVTPEPYHVLLESDTPNISTNNEQYIGASTRKQADHGDYYDTSENNHYQEAVVQF